MLIGLEAIMPLFFIIGCGYVAKITVLDDAMLPAINQFVYFFAVPALLFRAAMGMSLAGILYWPGIIGFVVAIGLTIVLQLGLGTRLFPGLDTEAKIISGLNSTFANFAYMGIPLVFTVLGQQASAVTVAIILLGNLLIIGGVQLAIEFHRQHHLHARTLLVIVNNALLKNPIFISTCLGVLFSVAGTGLPAVVDKATQWLADAAIPVALFCLGAGLNISSLSGNRRWLFTMVAIKLIMHPAITWLTLQLVGAEDPVWVTATVLLTALPTGALAHVVALKYNACHQETSQVIVVSTLCSLVTVSVWVALLV